MKNKGFFSKVLFIENLKRFWPLAFVGFVICFLSGPMSVIRSGAKNGVRFALIDLNPGYMFVALTLSVAAAVCVFGYLQKVSSVSVMHSMPFSRRSLYVTSYLSGLFIALLPMILTLLTLAVLRKPVYPDSDSYWYLGLTTSLGKEITGDVFSFGMLLRWFAGQFVLIAFSYSVSVLAGIISGNTVIHALTACGLNAIVPALYGLYLLYRELFLWGVPASDLNTSVLLKMHPVFSYLSGGLGPFGLSKPWNSSIYAYIAVTIAVTLLGFLLYRIRPLERATDSYVFRPVSYLITALLVLCFGSIIGMIMNEVTGGYSGYIIGSVASFVAAEMIVRKTTRIVSRESLISLVLCAAMMTLLVGGFAMDLFGIEDVIPKAESIESVNFNDWVSSMNSLTADNEKSIEDIRALHSMIIENKEFLQNRNSGDGSVKFMIGDKAYDPEEENWTGVKFVYQLKNGDMLTRQYDVPVRMLAESKELQAAYLDTDNYITGADIMRFDPEKLDVGFWFDRYEQPDPNADGSFVEYSNSGMLSTEQKAALIEAVAKDCDEFRNDISKIYEWRLRNDAGIAYGYLHMGNRISEAEYKAEMARGLSFSELYRVSEISEKSDDVTRTEYERTCDLDLSKCGDNVEAVLLRFLEEIPELRNSAEATRQ
ncbi:MAG: hypothetical protein II488_06585 [Firmicutes bacterium]|nr:hypothetical protein [Bacillota bacterium]